MQTESGVFSLIPRYYQVPDIRDGVMTQSPILDEPARRHQKFDAKPELPHSVRTGEAAASPLSASAASLRLHVLLAEDNPVNQFVATRQLKKQGHTVHLVTDGQAVLDAVQQEQFDLVLMDIQMPVMDGFRCVAEMRRREASTGEHLPVIGMTAHTVAVDLQRCLESGMDDYISKPIQACDLAAAVSRIFQNQIRGETNQTSFGGISAEHGSHSPCHLTDALKSLDGDKSFLRQLIQVFIDTVPERLKSLELAIESGDRQLISDVSHSIKGSVSYFLADPAYEAAHRLEIICQTGERQLIDQAHSQLLLELQRLIIALQEPAAV
jgi:two-component system, sensor histidine kinase and response regulator